jgi:hypothetical protein
MPTNTIEEFEQGKVIGYVLSMLFGLVFKDIISSFDEIIKGISFLVHDFSYETALFVTIVFCTNVFRMFHGFMISLYDKRNPTYFGPYPYSLYELFILVFTFLGPLIAVHYMKNNHNNTPIALLAFQAPMFTYVLWDFSLRKQLVNIIKKGNKDESSDEEKASAEKAKNYKKFVDVWIILDYINTSLILLTIGLIASAPKEIYYPFFFLIGIVYMFIILFDYNFKNKEFYFPEF